MMKIKLAACVALIYALLLPSFTYAGNGIDFNLTEKTSELYQSIDFGTNAKPDYDLFHRAMVGFYQLKVTKKLSDKDVITVIDFRKSANEKRLWVIDLKKQKVLFHTLVAHGRNTGEVHAQKFSNINGSNQSSLGFYITKQVYTGKHGKSLQLEGVERGINDHALSRAIVMHGADYVSDSFIKKVGRLGRSQGCPAVPAELSNQMVDTLASGTCLFIFYPDKNYLDNTAYNNSEEALKFLSLQQASVLSKANP